MRSTNSIKNAIVSIITNIIIILIGLVAQAVFVKTLGTEYLGINGLFTNIFSMLAIVELGIGPAIVYSLYKPIAEGNKGKIKSLMLFYKKCYRIVALIVFVIGLAILPFLGNIVGVVTIPESINFLFILFLIDVIASYLLSYKRSILYADQKTYITNLIHIGCLIVMNIAQIAILLYTKNYILYLLIKIICRILENLVITIIANKKYPYIKDKNVENLDDETKTSIFTRVKGLIYHKIGTFVVMGSDNIIISIFFGVTTVGLYSNYLMIINAVSTLFKEIFSSIRASVGNLLIEKDKDKNYSVFKSILMLDSWIFMFACSGILCLIEPFISIWIGHQYLLGFDVLVVLVINLYMQGMREAYNTFKTAGGIFFEDRFVPLVESAVNILASIIFIYFFGLAGVFLGTITSTLILFAYSYPKYVYKMILGRNYIKYIKELVKYIVLAVIPITITAMATRVFDFDNALVNLFINMIIVIIIPNLFYYLVFRKSEEYKYCLNLVKRAIKINKD